jgi:RNA ligase (TIGR02306 family)
MSEFHVVAQRLGKFGKHPKADTLSIINLGGYPVIFKTEAFREGDLVVRIPPDAVVDTTREEFSFLAKDAKNDRYRVKAIKMRDVPSHGFLVPAPSDAAEGQDVRHLLGVEKYDPGPCYQIGGHLAGQFERVPQENVVPQYDIEGMRKYSDVLEVGEPVVATEKIHGSNGRWAFIDGTLYCGSRTKFRKESVWNRMAEKYELERILSTRPGLVLYGEVYGSGIQDLTYGLKDEQRVAFFDVYDSRTGKWYDVEQFATFCEVHDLPTCPVLYEGPYDPEKMFGLAEGPTLLGWPIGDGVEKAHVREGIVIKPTKERWSQDIGRAFLKLVGEGYLLRKEKPAKEAA